MEGLEAAHAIFLVVSAIAVCLISIFLPDFASEDKPIENDVVTPE